MLASYSSVSHGSPHTSDWEVAEVDRETGGDYYYCLDERGERGLGSEYLSDYFSGAIQARPGSVV